MSELFARFLIGGFVVSLFADSVFSLVRLGPPSCPPATHPQPIGVPGGGQRLLLDYPSRDAALFVVSGFIDSGPSLLVRESALGCWDHPIFLAGSYRPIF